MEYKDLKVEVPSDAVVSFEDGRFVVCEGFIELKDLAAAKAEVFSDAIKALSYAINSEKNR